MRIFTIQLRDVNIHEAGFTLSSHVISGLIDGICHFTHSYDVRTGSVILGIISLHWPFKGHKIGLMCRF